MRTKRQKTVEGQHLSPVELERDRATAVISVFAPMAGSYRSGDPPQAHAERPVGRVKFSAPLMASRRERSHLSAGDNASTGDADLARLSGIAEIRSPNSADDGILTLPPG